MTDDPVPELLPARMINEVSYCPRLFHLEWVQAQWASNEDTASGEAVHTRVDKPRGEVKAEAGFSARSVKLASERLGLVAVMDIVEGNGQAVRPVDYKKGKAPDVPEGAYEPERVQLCAQALLLRDAGYVCDEGVLYFAASRQRVTIPIDEPLIERTQELMAEARKLAASDQPPPPLVESRKCPRCSLVGICLPDEVNALAQRTEARPRRLIPSAGAARPLYVSTQGAMVSARGGRFEVRLKGEEIASARPIDVSQICVYGNVQVSTQALKRAFTQEIPVCYFSYGGWLTGLAHGMPGKNVELRRRQVIAAGRGGLGIARAIVGGKVKNCRTLLRRNARSDLSGPLAQLGELAESATTAVSVTALLGIEGTAARIYFHHLPAMLRDDLDIGSFDGEGLTRTRRPPRDPVNCLLSYLYALVVKDLTAVTYAIGLDPYLGLYHRPRFGRSALGLDLMEEFRPLVADSTAITLLNTREITMTDFIKRNGGVALTDDGRRAVLRAYERRLDTEIIHPMFGYRITYRRVYEVQARLLGAHLLGEVPAYVPFCTR
jgi:CRISPR-associated protein Cas1